MALGTTGMVAVAALVAGLAGAGAALAVRGGSPVTASVAESARVADLEERIAKQDAEIRTLLARVDELSAASRGPAAAPSDAAPELAVDGETPEGSVASGESGGPAPSGGDATARRERMRDVRGALRGNRSDTESAEKRRKNLEDGVRSRLDALPAELNLTASQKDEVVRLMAERQEKTRVAFEEARAAGGPDAMKTAQQKAEEARKESRTALEALLTPEQLAAWERAGDRGQAGGLGRRAGRGAGGGGGGTPPAGGGETPR